LATQRSYWSLQEASLAPACILTPETPQDVSAAVSIIPGIESCHFAIKGQSHAPAAGFANINEGVTIDMTKLKSVAVNANRTVASVGAGASWLDVYLYLDTLGLSVAGARNGAVGVGGLTLGGGISYFAPRVGFTCDTVFNFEVLLKSSLIPGSSAYISDCPRVRRACQRQRYLKTRPLPRSKRRSKQFWRRNSHRFHPLSARTDLRRQLCPENFEPRSCFQSFR